MNAVFAKAVLTAPKFLSNPIFKSSPLIDKTYQFALKYFDFGQNVVILGFGLKETVFDFPVYRKLATNNADSNVKKIFKSIAEQSIGHGLFYILSGSLAVPVAMSDLGLFSLGASYPILGMGASLSFLIANLISLEKNIRIYAQADEILKDGKRDKSLPRRLKVSSALGIVNNLGYIIATILALFGSTAVPAIILGLFAVFDGCLKIIFDFFFVGPRLLHG